MAANTTPLFPLTPNNGWSILSTISATVFNNHNGASATAIYTAGVNGSRVDFITIVGLGSNNNSVLRLFVNNGSSNATTANNVLFNEYALASATITETTSNPTQNITLGLTLAPSYRLLACLGTTASAGWAVGAFGGDY